MIRITKTFYLCPQCGHIPLSSLKGGHCNICGEILRGGICYSCGELIAEGDLMRGHCPRCRAFVKPEPVERSRLTGWFELTKPPRLYPCRSCGHAHPAMDFPFCPFCSAISLGWWSWMFGWPAAAWLACWCVYDLAEPQSGLLVLSLVLGFVAALWSVGALIAIYFGLTKQPHLPPPHSNPGAVTPPAEGLTTTKNASVPETPIARPALPQSGANAARAVADAGNHAAAPPAPAVHVKIPWQLETICKQLGQTTIIRVNPQKPGS